ncbi:DnaB-like helicase C-terminal domain-containing protein [Streptomyces sp. BE20]|uniref:DnaB-like helicase C-terminal domain-containing protein n=1 Tax=Streptomyces sp. BE20 TaxID=3002525 RepID=UPI002E7A6A9B|nr:DnaB-like helicase C-terminal domain-containing protein [Streptomyces sp. BE20]MEE1821252.1 DnaB-like helicase C-terminal domain-containing protein [Streptomyces sp. BE20]
MVGIGAHRGHREAAAGIALALHTAGSGHSTLLFAPELPARNAVPNLRIERPTVMTPERIREIVTTRIALRQRPDVVVVDHFALLRPDPPAYEPDSYDPWDDPAEDKRDPAVQEADEIGRQLKLLATRHDLAVVVMAHVTHPVSRTEALTVDHLGLAASLEYDADAVLLLRRADDRRVDVHVAKNRTGPAPHRFTTDW